MKRLIACLALTLFAVACNSGGGGGNPADPSQVTVEFSVTDLAPGEGPQAAAGNTVTVHYTGWLYNPAGTNSKGNQFDTSSGRAPLAVVLGVSNIIPGFQQGLIGMRVGGRRRMYIPPNLAYGAQGSGPIPPNASIVFEVEMMTLVQ